MKNIMSACLILFCSLFLYFNSTRSEIVGDVNNDEKINLTEAIFALKVASGMNESIKKSAPLVVASGQDVIGPDENINNAIINLEDYGFKENGLEPHFIVSQRNFNYASVDGNTMDASYCGYSKLSKLKYQVSCWASTNASGPTVQSSFDWFALQILISNSDIFKVASGKDISGPNNSTNKSIINLKNYGFSLDSSEPHIIVSERNYNYNSIDGNTMDASYCGYSKISKLEFEVSCWASTNASGPTVQSSFDWMAIQLKEN